MIPRQKDDDAFLQGVLFAVVHLALRDEMTPAVEIAEQVGPHALMRIAESTGVEIDVKAMRRVLRDAAQSRRHRRRTR